VDYPKARVIFYGSKNAWYSRGNSPEPRGKNIFVLILIFIRQLKQLFPLL